MLGVSTGSFPRMPTVTVERTYLQLLAPGAERTAPKPLAGTCIAEESPCSVETYRELYREVGRAYFWLDRLSWSDDVLATYLARPEVRIWILRDADGIGGYFELAMGTDRAVEVAYFGLVPSRHGRGLGRALLARAIDEGWEWGASRIWLHTCTLDGPAALPNYLARGFVPFKRETYVAVLPDA